MRIVGIILVVLGALILGYGGFSYATRETVAEAGPVEVTTEKQKTVWVPPVVGGIAVVTGLIMLTLSGGRRE